MNNLKNHNCYTLSRNSNRCDVCGARLPRLIDADALKEAFEEVYPLATNEMGGAVNKRIYDIIDNAPTIESLDLDVYIGGRHCGKRQRLLDELRPKGEWIRLDNGSYMCSKCYENDYPWKDYNFCPNCGSDNRGDMNGM